jgi:LysR family transcriptional regulator, transcriptional activator for bauABCD operon
MDNSNIDLRLLRVFKAVVDAGGFANAQAVLDLNPSTISMQMSALEAQLGYSLCQRGRSGFKLTERGTAFHRHVVDLFMSLQHFQAQATELKGDLSGTLRIGFLDNVISDPESPLREALARFVRKRPNRVHLTLDVLGPRELESGLLCHSIDVAVGIFFNELPSLTYRPLYSERDVLVCHITHPLAKMQDTGEQARAVPRAARVIRTFMGEREFPFNQATDGPMIGEVTNVEAASMLILSGEYIGFLPHHFARDWIESGEFVVLLPERFVRRSQFSLVTRTQAALTSPALQAFLNCVAEVRTNTVRSPLALISSNANVAVGQCI